MSPGSIRTLFTCLCLTLSISLASAGTMTVLDSTGATQTVFKPVNGPAVNYSTGPLTPTIQNAAYSVGNCMGGLQTVTFFRSTGQPTANLSAVSILWEGAETTPITVYIFSKNPTGSTFTDKSTFSIAAADAKYLIGAPVTLTPFVLPGNAAQTMATATISLPVQNLDTSVGLNLYVAFEVGAAVTPAVGDLVFTLTGVQD